VLWSRFDISISERFGIYSIFPLLRRSKALEGFKENLFSHEGGLSSHVVVRIFFLYDDVHLSIYASRKDQLCDCCVAANVMQFPVVHGDRVVSVTECVTCI
jgi:hypothetical protein